MTELMSYVWVGLGNGAIYAMLGLGLVVIYRSTGLLNFAQGEIAMFTAYVIWTLIDVGLPSWVALFAGIGAGFLLGALIHQIAVRPVGDAHVNPLATVIVTVGLFLAIGAVAQSIWGTAEKPIEPFFGSGRVELLGADVTWQRLGTLAVLAVEAFVFFVVFQRTKVGLAMRAVASNPESSALSGIPVNRLLMLGWGLAAAIGAVAGVFTAVDRTSVSLPVMQTVLIFAFAAVAVGGFDSLLGAVVGGLLVGLATEVVPNYVGWLEKMRVAPAFALILLVLLIRPEGLFGSKKVARV